jgi:hypothetical protein
MLARTAQTAAQRWAAAAACGWAAAPVAAGSAGAAGDTPAWLDLLAPGPAFFAAAFLALAALGMLQEPKQTLA